MTIINPLTYNIANGQAVDATPLMADLNQIVSNVNTNAAALAGNAAQEFLVATTTNSAGAVPLAQAQSQFAALAGSSSQVFNAAPATTSTEVPPLGQVVQDKISIYEGAATNLPAGAFTKLNLSSIVFDTNSLYNGASGFTVKRAGYYTVHGQASAALVNTNDQFFVAVYVNGTNTARGSRVAGNGGTTVGSHVSALLYLAVGDIVELWCYATSATTTETGIGIVYLQADGPML